MPTGQDVGPFLPWKETLAALAVMLLTGLQQAWALFFLAPFVLAVYVLFFQKVRCGAPTRRVQSCRMNVRGRWRGCRYEAHGRMKHAAILHALRGNRPRPSNPREPGEASWEGGPLDDPWVSSPLVVRAAVVGAPLCGAATLLFVPWGAVPPP
ncbi:MULTISPECIES: hypothetical protein [unclassified Nocardiopsis]|uniref:hypothetical protein n=1 Tax=Nocardiopsis TaxID=2013 RepID=UPI00387B7CBE